MSGLNGVQRQQVIDDIATQQASGQQSLGTAIRRLRLEVTGFDQETFASMCKLSSRALYLIETDKGNPTLKTLDSILSKFGLRLGLMAALSSTTAGPTPVTQTPPPVTRGAKPQRLAAKKTR